MKTKSSLLSSIVGITLGTIVIIGCHKDSTSTPSTSSDITAAQDEANASDAMNDTKNVSDAAMQGKSNNYSPSKGLSVYSSQCTVTWNDTSSATTDTLYINFGATPVKCNDGRWRQGEIVVYWNKGISLFVFSAYFDSTNSVNMTFRNYASGNSSSNMIGITGSRTWTNLGWNSYFQVNWKFTANLTLTYPNGQKATWTSNRTNTLVVDHGVFYYEITGSGSGTSREGAAYNVNITSPLYVTAAPWWLGGCAYIEAGIVTVTQTGSGNVITINYGTLGVCSANKTATIDGNSYTFVMW